MAGDTFRRDIRDIFAEAGRTNRRVMPLTREEMLHWIRENERRDASRDVKPRVKRHGHKRRAGQST